MADSDAADVNFLYRTIDIRRTGLATRTGNLYKFRTPNTLEVRADGIQATVVTDDSPRVSGH